jgi:fermentation-respiration switch protein FrsA (DUF1100 family)
MMRRGLYKKTATAACAGALCVAALFALVPDSVSAAEHLDVVRRGHALPIELERPRGAIRGTVIMASGDVGWVGLAVTLSRTLVDGGYVVAGLNTRQYLSVYTSGRVHLTPDDIAGDYVALCAALHANGLAPGGIVVAGVSEGAAFGVLAASTAAGHAAIAGVVTLGLPQVAEIAWRWTDFTSWITKRDADEPSITSREYLAKVAPLPIVMIQSTRDEYVSAADSTALEAAARAPKRRVLIDASNHRFTDRLPQVKDALLNALAWVAQGAPS